MASSPAYAKYPNHKIELEPKPERVRAMFGGEAIADSARCRLVLESRHDAVVYFPREDVRMAALEKVTDTTFCPFKGTASYFTIRVGEHEATNAVWSYEDPYDEVRDLKDYMAFYVDRIDELTEAPG